MQLGMLWEVLLFMVLHTSMMQLFLFVRYGMIVLNNWNFYQMSLSLIAQESV